VYNTPTMLTLNVEKRDMKASLSSI